MAELEIPHQQSDISHVVTLSIGVASCYPRQDLKPDDLIATADAALYHAKSGGRDQIVAWRV